MPNLRTDILEQREQILEWIEQGQSKAFICKQFHCKPETLNSYLEKMGIYYEGNQGGKGIKVDNKYMDAITYANKESGVKSHILKQKLIRDGIKEHRCERCGLTTWNNQPIPLELHHKDGDHYNNNLDNLEILCPNCHSQENNNSGAGTNYNKQKEQKEEKPRVKYYCTECGVELTAERKTGLCMSCYKKSLRVAERPEPKQLAHEIVTTSFVAVGRKYGVSDNAIRKWCDEYQMPRKKEELKKWLEKN